MYIVYILLTTTHAQVHSFSWINIITIICYSDPTLRHYFSSLFTSTFPLSFIFLLPSFLFLPFPSHSPFFPSLSSFPPLSVSPSTHFEIILASDQRSICSSRDQILFSCIQVKKWFAHCTVYLFSEFNVFKKTS